MLEPDAVISASPPPVIAVVEGAALPGVRHRLRGLLLSMPGVEVLLSVLHLPGLGTAVASRVAGLRVDIHQVGPRCTVTSIHSNWIGGRYRAEVTRYFRWILVSEYANRH